jgi:hypothetical protein
VLLEGTGQRLHLNPQGYALRPREALLSDGEIERLARGRAARSGMRIPEARLLKLAVDGMLDRAWEASATESDRIWLASLLRQRLLVRREDGYRPTRELAESLDVGHIPSKRSPGT